jgi:hypothetical protein
MYIAEIVCSLSGVGWEPTFEEDDAMARLSRSNRRAVQAWYTETEVAEINQFRREQDDIPSLADAIRDLVKLGLTVASKRRERRATAAE